MEGRKKPGDPPLQALWRHLLEPVHQCGGTESIATHLPTATAAEQIEDPDRWQHHHPSSTPLLRLTQHFSVVTANVEPVVVPPPAAQCNDDKRMRNDLLPHGSLSTTQQSRARTRPMSDQTIIAPHSALNSLAGPAQRLSRRNGGVWRSYCSNGWAQNGHAA